MQKLSVWEFKEYCDNLSPRRYIFNSENQEWSRVEDTIRIKVEFGNMIISFNPNTIYLKSKNDFISLERVKYVKLSEKSLLGEVFTIVCGNSLNSLSDKSYTIIAQ